MRSGCVLSTPGPKSSRSLAPGRNRSLLTSSIADSRGTVRDRWYHRSNVAAPEEDPAVLTQEENDRLTRVGPGSPMGNLLRRYWHPVATAAELEQEPVLAVRLL